MTELIEPWMKKLKISPLALEPDLLDLSTKFRSRLYESLLTHGWDSSQSMIVATSDDPRLDGQILQGRHRAIIISQILKDGHKFDTSKILIRREEVANIDEMRALRAAYEVTAALTKDPKLSKKWVESNLRPIIKSRASEGHTKIISYLHQCGFNNDAIAADLIEHELEQLEKKRSKKQPPNNSLNIPTSVKDKNWNYGPTPEAIDDAASYIRELTFVCDHCGKENKQQVNVACGNGGELVKLAVARQIE